MMSTEPVANEKKEETVIAQLEKQPQKEHFSPSLLAFKQSLEKEDNIEERLKLAIQFMRESLSQEGVPRFKDFWDAKNLCLPLFKEKLAQSIKEIYWAKYVELASEAKRLKDILEEQSSFAVEQIELALKALDHEIQNCSNSFAKMASLALPEGVLSKETKDSYDQKQKEIQFFVALTSRLKGLREEVIGTEMRIRHKNRLLKEISSLGDLFIPKKKELIKEVSLEFMSDIQAFIEKNFMLDEQKIKDKAPSLHQLREEIKGLQEVAKKLSLNSHVFSQTRLKLSACWEVVKILDKEKKKEFLDKKHLSQKEYEEGLQIIETMIKDFEETAPRNRLEVEKKRESVFSQIDALSVNHYDKKALKDKLKEKMEEILKPLTFQENAHIEKQKQKELEREKNVIAFKQELKELVSPRAHVSLQVLHDVYQSFNERKKELRLIQNEENQLEELRKELYESLLLKRENEIEKGDSEGLATLLYDWEKFKEQSRSRFDFYRNESSRSGFDFEKAMVLRELVDLEKARLDRAIEKIAKLQDRLD